MQTHVVIWKVISRHRSSLVLYLIPKHDAAVFCTPSRMLPSSCCQASIDDTTR